jgi:hypothetical protein
MAGVVAGGASGSLLTFPKTATQWLFWLTVVLSVAWLVKAWAARDCVTCTARKPTRAA